MLQILLTAPATWVLSRHTSPPVTLLLWTLFAGFTFTSYRKKHSRSAARLAKLQASGCQPLPEVRGRLPGNVDILYNVAKTAGRDLPGAAFAELAVQYGHTYDLKPLGSTMIYTQDPQIIRHVLVENHQNYVKGRFLNELFNDVLGSGIFNSDGDAWKSHRLAARPFFQKENLTDVTVYARHASILADTITALSRDGQCQAVNFHDLAARFTLDAATDFLLGKSVGTLKTLQSQQPDPPYLEAFTRVQGRLARRLKAGAFWKLFDDRKAMEADMKIVKAVFQDALVAGAGDDQGSPQEASTKATLLGLLNSQVPALNATKQDEILNVLMAARDTTASLIASTFYELARHPHIQTLARQEVEQCVHAEDPIMIDNIRSFKLIRAILNETLRLYPPISANSRVALHDDVVESKGQRFLVPAGAHIAWGVFQMQRRKDIWGEDANEWRPERWMNGQSPTSGAFQAWGAGPRICIGQELAYIEASYIVAFMLRHFSQIALALDVQPAGSWHGEEEKKQLMPQAPVVTLTLKGGVWLRFAR